MPVVILTLVALCATLVRTEAHQYLCRQFRTEDPCLCPELDGNIVCPQFEMSQPSDDNSTLNIACSGKALHFDHQSTSLNVDFSEIRTVEVQSCVVNVPLEDTLDKIGIRDEVRAVIFSGGTRFEIRSPLSGLNLTKVKIYAENITWPNDDDDTLLPDVEQLEEFHLYNSDINAVPKIFLSNNLNLNSLYITGNKQLKILPDVLPIPSLKNLHLSNNNISIITATVFASLHNLKLLDLKQNSIKEIAEDAFKSNRKLEALHLRFDGARLPERIFEPLSQLQELSIVEGHLEHIQERLFRNQTTLRTLDLSGNRLEMLEGPIFNHLHALQDLILNNNYLKAIPRECFPPELNKLSSISLDDNKFTNIPESLPTSDFLKMRNNSIEKLIMHTIPRFLRKLDLSYNKIKHIVVEQHTLIEPRDLQLSIEGNPLKVDCNLIDFVELVQGGKIKLFNSDGIENLDKENLYCDMEPTLCPDDCNHCRLIGPKRQLVLNCSYKNLEKVPPIPPDLHQNSSSITLDVRNNAIRLLPSVQSNPGYGLINTLLMDNNLLESWSVSNLHDNLSVISLTNNKLFSLDRKLVESLADLANLKELHLLSNHWPCHCTLAKQMLSLQSKIVHFTNLTCGSGQRLTDFRKLCANEMLAFVLTSSIILALIASGFAFYYRYQLRIKRWLLINRICLSYNSETTETDANFKYDAFISYSRRDENFVVHELVPALEAPPHKFQLCIHLRDRVPSELTEEQILHAIRSSRRTIVYVTQNFLRFEWSRHEFRLAFEQSLRENCAQLIVILDSDVGRRLHELDPQLRVFFSTTTYLRRDDEKFWHKLVRAMPYRDVAEMHREQKAQRAEQRLRNNSLREINRRREQLDLGDVAL